MSRHEGIHKSSYLILLIIYLILKRNNLYKICFGLYLEFQELVVIPVLNRISMVAVTNAWYVTIMICVQIATRRALLRPGI